MTPTDLAALIDAWPMQNDDELESALERAFAQLAEATADGAFPVEVVEAAFRMCEREPLLLSVYFPMDLFLVHRCKRSSLRAAATSSLRRRPSIAVLSLFDPADPSDEKRVVSRAMCAAVARRFEQVEERALQERVVRWLMVRRQRGTWRGDVPVVARRPLPRDVPWRSFLGRADDAIEAMLDELSVLLDERRDGDVWKEAGVRYWRSETSECLHLDASGRVGDSLPFGLARGMTRQQVRERLGAPRRTEHRERDALLECDLYDDAYEIDGSDVDLAFDEQQWLLRQVDLWGPDRPAGSEGAVEDPP